MTPQPASPRWRDAAPHLLAAVLVTAAWLVRILPAWPDPVVWDVDTENVFARALDALTGGPALTPGSHVTPTALRLGPAYHLGVAAAWWAAGFDAHATWLVLVALDLLAILACVPLLGRALGPWGAWTVAWVLARDPLIVDQQSAPFWYQPHGYPWILPGVAALARFVVTGERWAWLLACAGVGLAAQLHAMAWTLVLPLAWGTLRGRRRLDPATVAIGSLLFALAALPVLRQVPLLLEPALWTSMVIRVDDPAVHGDAAHAWRLLGGDLVRRTGLGVVTLPLAVVVTLAWWRAPRAPTGPVGGLAAAWWVAIVVVVALVAHRWHRPYGLLTLVPTALLLGAVVHGLAVRSRAAAAGALLALGLTPSWPPGPGIHPRSIAWERLDVLEAAARAVRAVGFDPLDGPEGGVHAVPASWDATLPRVLLQVPSPLGPRALPSLAVRVTPAGAVHVEEVSTCADVTVEAEGLVAVGRCEGAPEAWLHVALRWSGACHDDVEAVVRLPRAGGCLAVLASPDARSWGPDARWSAPVPAEARVVDAFTAPRRWSADDLGLVPYTWHPDPSAPPAAEDPAPASR